MYLLTPLLKKTVLSLALCVFSFSLRALQKPDHAKKTDHHTKKGKGNPKLRHKDHSGAKPTITDSFSYALGVNYATYLAAQDIHIEVKDLARAMRSVFARQPLEMDSAQIQSVLETTSQQTAARMVAKEKQAFGLLLASNRTDSAIREIIPGLQYQILGGGDSLSPVVTDSSTVTVHYTGRLLNGRIFDSSEQRGEAAQFKVGGLITGWREALKKMKKGDKWRVFIASDLAYGDRGNTTIPGGAGLIFDIHLIDVQ